MNVLDLFCGLKGFSGAFVDRGHKVITSDYEKKFEPDICKDIMEFTVEDLEGLVPDVILASPPCECFSVASIGTYWRTRHPKAMHALEIVKKTLNLIYDIRPKFWFMENPTGMLRTIIGNPPVRIYFAQYGDNRLKPTDIWGRHPKGFAEMQIKDRSLLDYEKAPRGSNKGTQGMKNAEERAKIPYGFSSTICKLCEKNIGRK